MERLLVTGVDTLVGGNLALALADRCEVLGLYDRVALESPAVATGCWHPDDLATVAEHVERWQPQWMVHCGPLSAASWEAPGCPIAAAREAILVKQLADLAEACGSRLAIVSSDVVFAGPRMFHDESSPSASVAAQAGYVRNMERALQGRDALVVRTHAYGWSPDRDAAGFAERIFEALTTQTPLAVDGRRHATPILASDLAELMWKAYEARLMGVFHLAGAERTSPHRFAVELANAMEVDFLPRLSPGGPSADVFNEETSLSSKRARRMLSAATPTLREGLNRFVAQAHSGWRDSWRRVSAPVGGHAVAA